MYFSSPDGGFSQKPKHAASNRTDINVLVIGGLYFLFGEHILCHRNFNNSLFLVFFKGDTCRTIKAVP
jgi:hypothetical protein